MATKDFSAGLLFGALVLGTGHFGFGQTVAQKAVIKLTGIVLAADHRCATTDVKDPFCRTSDWALASGRKTYLLYGDIPTLERFERKRVNISGVLEEEPVDEYGVQMIRRSIIVHSMESSELGEQAIEELVSELKVVPWRGPENHCSPMCWDFAFTDPMVKILQAGRGAQDVLLRYLSDQPIQDQIVMLLGGIGDENAIWPIIETLTDRNDPTNDPGSKRLNLVGDLALTNLTVSDVIWHHGGGISPNQCPDRPKSCWSKWWLARKDSFKVGIGGDRLYTNYRNYGIYAQFGDTSVP
ncbi:MAG TPA: hypothetical protein VKQ11_19595 [Candidatus Sulfotelmatobacter sp.]|nr:hypothetical protein [Candidatus Sulfotelmatobacter sp.]